MSALSGRKVNCFSLIGKVDMQDLEESFERIVVASDGLLH